MSGGVGVGGCMCVYFTGTVSKRHFRANINSADLFFVERVPFW